MLVRVNEGSGFRDLELQIGVNEGSGFRGLELQIGCWFDLMKVQGLRV